ncbi:uroporphyrinogen decarboxylase [Egicoccus halophilus]|uniref:Uroporphyrinogen decarboxylase n=1 Tax=Egicoccus halophilus TaxID=1670830 RepID=A0A8J3ESX5_9ACTN|nr:uroporphyrinogen decarboxylase [Egicoccus halophilus]GGI08352.1 uroporphyrinogen decarboxylase [Egicoccus halophilus]
MSAPDVSVDAPPRTHDDSPFVRACRGLPHERVPVWFMRQAGRALAEYRAIREQHTFEQVVHTPELAAEVTLQPVRRYGVDAAILFSDIVTPVQALGLGVEIRPGVGPVVEQPFRQPSDLDRLRPLEPEHDLAFVLETVDLLVRELSVPLIGFAGAPFTVASYLIEGGPSKSYSRTKALMYGDEATWHRLMERLADITLASLSAQVAHGASAVQLFDSWAGALHPDDYVTYVLPHSRRVLAELGALGVPRIHFGVATGELLGAMAAGGAADVVGIDWRVPLAEGRRRVPTGIGIQGNLEPAVCLGPWEGVERRVRDVLAAADGAVDHVFNLGHGVLPATDPAVLQRVVELVHGEGRVGDHRGTGAEPTDG